MSVNFNIRLVRREDADKVLPLCREMFEESDFAKTTEFAFDRSRFEQLMEINPSDLYIALLAETEDGDVAGYITVALNYIYTKQPWAVLECFYVTPKFRKTAIPRTLAKKMTRALKSTGAVAFFANSISGTSASRTMLNMFRKLGFEETNSSLKIDLV